MFQHVASGAWKCAHGILLCSLLLTSGQVLSQCGSTDPGTSGNPFPLTIGTEAQCAAHSLPVPTPNAAQQSNVTPLGCGATQQRDIWFVFTASSTTTVINLYNVASANMGFMVYDAPCGAVMSLVGCAGYEYPASLTVIRGAYNTVVGNTYYVRVSRAGNNSFSNNLRICGWSWERPPDHEDCEASFENGTTAGWTCSYGFYNFSWNFPNPPGCLNPGGPNAPLVGLNGADIGVAAGDRHTVISDKLYLDPRTNFNVSGVAPGGGDYSFRLGSHDYGCGGPSSGFPFPSCPAKATSVKLDLLVTSDNVGFTYMFAAVLLNPSHAPDEQPRFEVLVTTPDGQVVDCSYFLFVAGSGLANFNSGPGDWQYTDWTEVGLDLSAYIGQTVSIEFRVAGCYPNALFSNNAGNHSAYAYIDAYCRPLIQDSPSFCADDTSVEICAPSGYINYSWPAGQPGLQPPLNQQCVTVLNPVAGTVYNVNMELITGCPTSTTIVMTGTPVTLTDDVTICAGQSVNLIVSVDDPDPDEEPYTFVWSHGPTGSGPHPVSPLETTTYTVTTTGASGCGSAANVTVEVEYCDHVVTVTGGETCPGGCVDLEAILTNDLFPPYTYAWSGGIPDDDPGPHSVCPTETTTYTVVVTDANGAIAAADVTVVVLPLPELTFDVTDVSCNGGSNGTATVIPSAATAPYTHSWNTVPPQTDDTATGLEAGTYTVTTTDANGCTSSADVTLTEPGPLTVSLTSTPANCGELDGTATAVAAGGTAPYSYAWDTAPVQVTDMATGIPTGPRTVTVTDANGCTVSGTTVVPSIGGADLSSEFTDASCNGFADGTATVIASNGTEPYAYSWNTVPVQITATATGLVAGSYTVTVTEDNGCIGFLEVVVSEPTAIVPVVTSIPGSCGLPNGTANASASGGVGPYTFGWDSDPPQSEATATGLLAGDYTVTVTDATGCTATATIDVINVPGPVAGFIGEDVCWGTATNFQNTSVNGVSWEWDMGDMTLFAQQNVQHTYGATGSYTVTLTATDISGCSDTFTSTVEVLPIPVAAFAGEPLQGCAPLVTAFQNTGTSIGPICLWEFGDGNSSTDCTAPVHTYVQAGCYDVTLTVTETGCSSSLTVPQMVCVDPVPVAGFSITPNPALTVSPLVVYMDQSAGASGFEWSFPGGVPETSDAPSVAVDYTGQEPGFFDVCLVVTNNAGCADSLCRVLILRDDLRVFVPNTFTPDGDGVNEVFIPVMVGHGSEQYLLSIFNRWGELIFETEDPMVGWDGTVPGAPAQDGVYVWRLRVKASTGAEIREFTGHVTLLR